MPLPIPIFRNEINALGNFRVGSKLRAILQRKRTRERDEEQDRTVNSRRSDRERDGDEPSPDNPPRRRRDRDFDRGR